MHFLSYFLFTCIIFFQSLYKNKKNEVLHLTEMRNTFLCNYLQIKDIKKLKRIERILYEPILIIFL